MNRNKNISFYLMLAGIAFIAFSVFLLWNSYKKKTITPEATDEDQDTDQEPEPEQKTAKEEPKHEEAPVDASAQTPPFVQPE